MLSEFLDIRISCQRFLESITPISRYQRNYKIINISNQVSMMLILAGHKEKDVSFSPPVSGSGNSQRCGLLRQRAQPQPSQG